MTQGVFKQDKSLKISVMPDNQCRPANGMVGLFRMTFSWDLSF